MMTNMVSFPTITSNLFSGYASFSTFIMLLKLTANEFLPHQVQILFYSTFSYLFNRLSSQLTLVIDESDGLIRNEIFEASKLFLGSRITPSVHRIRVMKVAKEENMALTIDTGEEVTDVFEGIQVKWTLVVTSKPENNQLVNLSYARTKSAESENRRFELKFHKNDKEKVLGSYLAYVLNTAKIIKQENKVTKLYTINQSTGMGTWQSINLEHPATFDLFAIDQNMKTNIIEDLDRFVKRREFYKKVGKAWKRGYLLYGPPGTGKSTLVAAMANYLKFDVYDMELSSVYSNASLRKLLLETTNRSILLIEDIDCSINLQNREEENSEDEDPEEVNSRNQVTLSGLLNFVDGLWSSCGDERIIIFTTNHKDRLDQALLRPGRMDMHIHLSYCTAEGFNVLALNYLGLHKNKDKLYSEIENAIEKCQVTAAEVAEELMKSEDVDIALGGVLKFLKRKEMEKSEQEQNRDSLKKRKTVGKIVRPRRKRRW